MVPMVNGPYDQWTPWAMVSLCERSSEHSSEQSSERCCLSSWQEDTSGRGDSQEAEKEIEKVELKLKGVMQLRGPTPLSVQAQVQQLINEASDLQCLAQMYIWWMPWC